MKSAEIQVGTTYTFVATDDMARKHLEGQPFEVVSEKKVPGGFRRGQRIYKKRFLNAAGDWARADELQPLDDQAPPAFTPPF